MTPLLLILSMVCAQAPDAPNQPTLPALFRKTSAISPDHSRLALGTIEEGVWVLDLATQSFDLRVGPLSSPTVSIAWSPDGGQLALHSRSGTLRVVDSKTGALISRTDTCQGQVAFAAGGDVVFVALGDRPAKLWPAKGGERIAALSVREGRQGTAMAVSRDGALVALGDEQSGIAVWNARTGERVYEVLDVPRGRFERAINALDFDPTGKTIAVGSSDCRVRLYELGPAKAQREFSFCDTDAWGNLEIGCVRFSPDGKRILATSIQWWEARVWDVATGAQVDGFDYEGSLGCEMPAWFSSDGRRVAMSMDCRTFLVGEPRLRPDPFWRRWAWYRSDGEVAWAEVAGHLEVQRVSDGRILARPKVMKP